MKFLICTISIAICFLSGSWLASDEQPEILKTGSKLPQFSLQDFRGKTWTQDDFQSSKALAVVFVGVECPLVKQYSRTLIQMKKELGADLDIVGINSNRQDSLSEIANFAKLTGVEFPLLKDPGNTIADEFGATRTPECFLFDSNRKLVYRGAIDDQFTYGKQKLKVKNEYLLDAVNAVLNETEPGVRSTDAEGCLIGRQLVAQPGSTVTYANQVSRIFNSRCVTCHRPGEVAPFSMSDYDEVVGWAEMIAEVVTEQRMPPWHANPAHGKFKNDASLTTEEIELITTWVENGAPLGDETQLPEPPQFVEGWQIGKPDVIIPMRKFAYRVPAKGVIPYKHFVVDPGFKEDKWVQAAEIRIGNRAVVHHVIVGLKDDDERQTHGQIESEWITATAPGSPPLILPDGYAKKIPAGSKLVFQMHYTPNGTSQSDISSVGFKFVDASTVKKVVGTREATNRRFRIPPGDDNYKVESRHRFGEDALVLKLFPHMHLRGKSFRYTAFYPDGSSEILLDIPAYDFKWQNGYEFEEPKLMPRGTMLHCVAHFDNSKENFANPDPTRTVRWGDQTWDEMMIGYFDMVLADQDLTQD